MSKGWEKLLAYSGTSNHVVIHSTETWCCDLVTW